MRSLSFSGNIKKINHNAFTSCRGLKRLTIPEGVEVLGLDCFAHCSSLERLSLPSTLSTISRGVFWCCTNLREVTIPASVNTIGEYVFFYCDSLTDVYNHAQVPQVVPPIFNKTGITLHVPEGTEAAEDLKDRIPGASFWMALISLNCRRIAGRCGQFFRIMHFSRI